MLQALCPRPGIANEWERSLKLVKRELRAVIADEGFNAVLWLLSSTNFACIKKLLLVCR